MIRVHFIRDAHGYDSSIQKKTSVKKAYQKFEKCPQEKQRQLSKILQEKLTVTEIQGSTSTFELCWLETAGKFLQV